MEILWLEALNIYSLALDGKILLTPGLTATTNIFFSKGKAGIEIIYSGEICLYSHLCTLSSDISYTANKCSSEDLGRYCFLLSLPPPVLLKETRCMM